MKLLNILKIFFINLLVLILFSFNSLTAVELKNVNEILISNFGWNKNQIGPFGQFYRIDVEKGKSYLDLHPIIKQKYGGKKKSFICDLFKTNTPMIIKNDYLIKSNYSPEKALEARRKYMATGKLSENEWSLVDISSWLTYIKEGTGSNEINQEVFYKKLKILSCSSHHTEVSYNFKKLKFPNLILTMPIFIYLDPNLAVSSNNINNKFNKNKTNDLVQKYMELQMENAKFISAGLISLEKNMLLSKTEVNNLQSKVFSLKPINASFLGGICKNLDLCKKFLLSLNDIKKENIDAVLDHTRKQFMKKYSKQY